MQTFLPYPEFSKSVACLDYRRLGKQRVECKQILNALWGMSTGWRNHPATKMWDGYTDALTCYMNMCILEWEARGYKNNMELYPIDISAPAPHWLGNPELHASHRSNLLRKDADYYSQFGWSETPDLPYYWPM